MVQILSSKDVWKCQRAHEIVVKTSCLCHILHSGKLSPSRSSDLTVGLRYSVVGIQSPVVSWPLSQHILEPLTPLALIFNVLSPPHTSP